VPEADRRAVPWTLHELFMLADRFGADYKNDHAAPLVKLVMQCDGDVVHVPPGWVHMVVNTAASVKVAFDMVKASAMVRYAMSWARIATQVTKHNAPDYMDFPAHAVEVLTLARMASTNHTAC
jgi:oxalate decarboxylase/phosphoglucose isomerase-like protein (cupin superfamily)